MVDGGTAPAPDLSALDPVLSALERRGVDALTDMARPIDDYITRLSVVDPDTLARRAALAYWLNLYNAGALDLARRTFEAGATTVLRIDGAFDEPFITVAGEELSLDGVEHGKVRRFGDPRIHAALVCGSVSCPTLRYEAYRPEDLDAQLDAQTRSFLTEGGLVTDRDAGRVLLSRVFLWYGGDWTRAHRMPTLLPARRSKVLEALLPWVGEQDRSWIEQAGPAVSFQPYDWSLGCRVGGR